MNSIMCAFTIYMMVVKAVFLVSINNSVKSHVIIIEKMNTVKVHEKCRGKINFLTQKGGTTTTTTAVYRPLFQDNLDKLVPERYNRSGFK